MSTISPNIVLINASVTPNPAPSTLQASGALVSVGGTTLTQNTYQFLADSSALSSILSSEGNYVELGYMNGTFFGQQSVNPVGIYVLELGVQGSAAAGITALEDWITANPGVFYAFVTPATWDASGAALNTAAANWANPSGQTYFFTTTTNSTISAYAGTKSIAAVIEAPTASASEFDAAGVAYQWLANNPTPSTPGAAMGFRFLYGNITPWVLANNLTDIQDALTAYGNIVLTGAEGNISTSTLRNGTFMDGNQMGFWYAADWLQIQCRIALAAAIITGSQPNQPNPLLYNQNGINQLLAIAQAQGKAGIANGLLQSATFTAIPFSTYTAANPGDYSAGKYNGLSCVAEVQGQFLQITFDVDFTQFGGGA